jgi:peptidoglycan/xylan/chitin deacetylase (PgdA/CDA1 family)
MLRDTLKSAIERSVVLSGMPFMSRLRRRSDVLILAYHNIVPTGEQRVGDTSLHLPQRAFAQQLDMLQETHEIVSLSQVLSMNWITEHQGGQEYAEFTTTSMEAPATTPTSSFESGPQHTPRRATRPRVVITFDDAYRGTLTAGLAELKKRGLPATVFVAPAYIGGKSFWWDVLTPPNALGLDEAMRERALTVDAGRGVKILDRARSSGSYELTRMPEHAQCVTEIELSDALSYEHLTVGSHSWSHPNLTQLSSKELSFELCAPRQWLTERCNGRVVPVISYPYGRANENVWKAAATAGYEMGLMIDGGWATLPITSRYAVPRLNIPSGVSADGFALRASGILTA